VAVAACAAVAVVAWVGGRWLADRAVTDQASRQVAVELVLQSADIHQQGTARSWVAEVRGVLVNSGPRPVVVQAFDWAGTGSGGPFTVVPQGSSPVLTVLAAVDCHPAGSTRVPMPTAGIRVRTLAGGVTDRTPVVLNPEVWDQAVERTCLVPTPSPTG